MAAFTLLRYQSNPSILCLSPHFTGEKKLSTSLSLPLHPGPDILILIYTITPLAQFLPFIHKLLRRAVDTVARSLPLAALQALQSVSHPQIQLNRDRLPSFIKPRPCPFLPSPPTLDCCRYSLLETAPALRTRGEDKIELEDVCDLSQLSVRLDDFLKFQESSALFVYKNSQQFLAI